MRGGPADDQRNRLQPGIDEKLYRPPQSGVSLRMKQVDGEDPSILWCCSGHKKSQGHKTRAPEGMSILAFLWISPFLRYLTPLTILSISDLDHSESRLICLMRGFTGDYFGEIFTGETFEISFPRDPTCTLFQASKRAYGIKISASLRFCHFPFANRYR